MKTTRPNIVLFLVDDMGFSDLGCFGSEIATPHLDNLAANGVRFTHMYSVARCCPSRASILTGLHPHQAGVGHMTADFGKRGYRGDLNKECVTIAEVLHDAGYSTYMSGKWHVTPSGKASKDNWPLQRGFDKFFGTIEGAGSYYDPVTLARDNDFIEPGDGFFYTDAIGEHAAQFVEEAHWKAAPFFMYVPFTAPHWPLHAAEKDIAKYRSVYQRGWDVVRAARYQKQLDSGIIDARWALTPRDPQVPPWDETPNQAWEAERMAVYAAQVAQMDRNVGRVVEKLRELDELDNTLILFLSDNGGCAEGLDEHIKDAGFCPDTAPDGAPMRAGNNPVIMPGGADTYASYGVAWANVSDTPFVYYKHWTHEGGIASPTIIHWPAATKGGTISGEVAHLVDIMATFVDAAGADYPKMFGDNTIPPMEGKSLVPVLKTGTREGHEHLCWEHESNCAVRKGRWKLVKELLGEWELYDMEADRTERHDLAAQYPDVVKELAGLHKAWADRVGVIPFEEFIEKQGGDAAKFKRFWAMR